MSRIEARFTALRANQEKALIGFVTAGDPFPDDTDDLIVTLAQAGADIVEIGIPFSDPLLDGPTIQASTQRALTAGMTPPRVLDIIRQVRRRSEVPLVIMGAYNPVMQYGVERFAQDAVGAGADGAIVTDLIPEEAGEWKRVADAVGLDTIFLLSPASTPARMALVGKMTTGFIYCMSRTGITGARTDIPPDLPPVLEMIRQWAGDTPIAVGFGVSTPEHVSAIGRYADGVVVASASIDRLYRAQQEGSDKAALLQVAADFMTPLKKATLA